MDENEKPKSMSKIDLPGECPVCGKPFSNVKAMIGHIKMHNQGDDEYELSVVAEQDKYIRELF